MAGEKNEYRPYRVKKVKAIFANTLSSLRHWNTIMFVVETDKGEFLMSNKHVEYDTVKPGSVLIGIVNESVGYRWLGLPDNPKAPKRFAHTIPAAVASALIEYGDE